MQKEEDKICTVQEAANYLKISTSTIRRMANQRKISSFRVNTRIRFHLADLDEYVKKTTQLSVDD
jgi:excisionase family DNA binding protein